MENQTCLLHNVPLFGKEWNGTILYSHIIKDVGFCNGKKITPFKPQTSIPTVLMPTVESITREPIAGRDYDAENRGKVRHGVATAILQHDGLVELTQGMVDKMDRWVEYIMEGDKKI